MERGRGPLVAVLALLAGLLGLHGLSAAAPGGHHPSTRTAPTGGQGAVASDDTDSMPRVMPEQQLAGLMAARRWQFDETFLRMMIEHHRGPVEMARTQQGEGENREATALAERMDTTQTQEIKEMGQLLQS